MENQNQYDELLIRYLTNEVNADERKVVESWIGTSVENYRYYESLRDAWQLASVKHTLDYVIDKMDVDKKWNQFKQNVTANKTGIITMDEPGNDPGKERPFRQSIVKRFLIPAAVAASLLLVFGLGWIFFFQARQPVVAIHTEKNRDTQVTAVRREVNTTGSEKRILLSDGSLIMLADKSEITYKEPFVNGREITLKGKAYFKVFKDQTRPFSVTSGDISTTALGTAFTVTAFAKNNRITVRLYEGKVLVKSTDQASKRIEEDVYLLPGQEFIYVSQAKYKVRSFKPRNGQDPEKIIHEESSALDNPSIPQDEGSWYMFNNESLEQVLDELAALYKVEIIYDNKDVQNIYFTGHYNNSASIEAILKRIGTLNNLTITKNDTAFIISR